MQIKVISDCFFKMSGEEKLLTTGEVYTVSPSEATSLVKDGRAKVMDSGLILVKALEDDVLEGLRAGEKTEIRAQAAEQLVKRFKAEFYDPDGTKITQLAKTKIHVHVIENVFVGDDILNEGRSYDVDPETVTFLLKAGKVKLPDTMLLIKVEIIEAVIYQGATLLQGENISLSKKDALQLIKKGRAKFTEPDPEPQKEKQ